MAMRIETNPLEAAYAVLLEHGLDGADEALRIPVNEATKIERNEFLGARPYARTASRRDYANDFKPKTMLTRLGELTFEVPHVRSGDFDSSALGKGTRTDQTVSLVPAEMYVQGVSTRRVIEVLQRLQGAEISLSCNQVSQAAATLDEGLKPGGDASWARCLIFLDARYEKVRLEGRLVDCTVLMAVGVESSGKRRALDCEVATSEVDINWRRFLGNLLARGLKEVQFIVADDHAGLKAARRPVCHSPGGPKNGGRPDTRHLQCPRQGRGRAALEKGVRGLVQGTSQPRPLGRRSRPGESDRLRRPAATPHPAGYHHRPGACQPGGAPTDTRGEYLPEPGIVPAPGLRFACQTRRRVVGRQGVSQLQPVTQAS